MSTFVDMGGEQVDVRPHVEQAIKETGWVQPSAAPWLAVGLTGFSDRAPGRAIRKALGENRWMAALTEKGLKDPIARFDATAEYALKLSMAEARWRQAWSVRVDRPYLRYVAVMDNRTHPGCARRHNTVLPIDHPWWRKNAPPRNWRCRCMVTSLSMRDLARYGYKVSDRP